MQNPEDIDRWALNDLEEELGFTLEGNRPVHFYFYFPKEHQAYHVAATLTNLQFDTEISYSDYGQQWLCLATKCINMDSGRLADLRNWMEELAGEHHGEYDGWETMISPEEGN